MKRLITGILLLGMVLSVMGTSSALSIAAVTTETVQPVLVIGGKEGTKPSEFNEPDSVYVSRIDGKLYAGDTVNLRVQVFDADGNYLSELTGFTPLDDASGNEAQGIGELSDGTIVVIEKAGNLTFFDPESGDIKMITDLSDTVDESSIDTQGLAVDPRNDYIYITNQPENLVYVIAPNGTLVDEWSVGQFSTPENMVVDAANNRIFVSAEGQRTIRVFDVNGTMLDEFGKDDVGINYEGLTLDPLGNLIAMDEGGDSATATQTSRFIIFDGDDFTPLYAVGDTKSGTGLGQFVSPDGIAYDFFQNRVVVADQGNFRIQIFDYIAILKSSGIYEDTTAPTVSDVSDTNATLGQSLEFKWDLADESPFSYSYSLTVDGTEAESGIMLEANSYTYSTAFDTAGTYEVKLTVTDAFGNSASDTVTVTVADDGAGESTKESSPAPVIAFLSSVALLPILRKKYRSQ